MRKRSLLSTILLITIGGSGLLLAPLARAAAGWTPAIRLTNSDGSLTLSGPPGLKQIAAGPDGRIHVVWADNRDGMYHIYYKCFDGKAWSKDECISQGYGLDPSISLLPHGRILVAWYWFGYDTFARIFDGSRWQNETKLSDCTPINSTWPSTVTDAAGRAHAFWPVSSFCEAFLMHRVYDGQRWLPCDTIPGTTGNPMLTAAACDSKGNLHLVWTDGRDGNFEIYYTTYDGSRWGAFQRLTSDPAASELPDVAISSKDVIYVVWQDSRTGVPEVYLKTFNGKWSPDQRLSADDGRLSGNPKIAIDSMDRVHIVWGEQRHEKIKFHDIYYRRSRPRGKLWSPPVRLTSDAAIPKYYSLCVDSAGNAYVVWMDFRNFRWDIYFKTQCKSNDPAFWTRGLTQAN